MKTCLKMTDVLFSATFCLFKKKSVSEITFILDCFDVTLSSVD